jgi:hypothetical protein
MATAISLFEIMKAFGQNTVSTLTGESNLAKNGTALLI